MYLLYLDDSGSAANKNENYLVLGGVLVFERQVHWISQELDKLAAAIWPASPECVEFHASDVFSGRQPPWNGIPDKAKRRQAIRDVLAVLARSHKSTCAFACAVHKASFPDADPMELAFEQLCSRFDVHLKRLYHTEGEPHRGLIILDESSYETSLQKLARDFRSLGTRWDVVRNLVEVPLFVDSRASRLLQLADHVAYAVFRRYEAGDTSYLDPILSRFVAEEGKLHGLVHRQTVDMTCMCPACMGRR
ncbi:MAG: DUF3800 domain-containing protein [Planctomycetes bacterium]|nr:DUF3800 domain-containing protein [Planctomycetota bacterium]